MDYWEQGTPATVRGALVIPGDVTRVDDPEALAAVLALLGGRSVVNFEGEATPTGLALEEIPRARPFRVPYAEKGRRGQLFLLTAHRAAGSRGSTGRSR